MGHLDELLRFTRFGAEDQRRLHALVPIAVPRIPEIVDGFYDELMKHDGTRALLQGGARLSRLQGKLAAWLESLLTGPWDISYYEARTRIGQRHVQVALPQRFMVMAMSQVLQSLSAIVDESLTSAEDRRATRDALRKVCTVDLTIMLESYQHASLREVADQKEEERQQLEEQLAVSEALYRAVLHSVEAIVVFSVADGRIAYVSEPGERFTGRTVNQMIGQSWVDLFTEAPDRKNAASALLSLRTGKAPVPFDVRYRMEGVTRWVRWRLRHLAGMDLPYGCAIGLDVSHERKFVSNQQRLERLASIGTMAAGLAHEIRNPLNAALLQMLRVQRMAGTNGGGKLAEPLDLAHTELRRLGELVQEFLDFGRPSPPDLMKHNVVEVLDGVLQVLRPEAELADVTLKWDCPKTPLEVVVDAPQIRKAVTNLVRNGIEATGEGGCVTVELEVTPEQFGISVSDDGPGLPADIDPFQPFSTTKSTGTGLGLPVVLRVAEDHDGEVTADRDEGWTSMRLTLPRI